MLTQEQKTKLKNAGYTDEKILAFESVKNKANNPSRVSQLGSVINQRGAETLNIIQDNSKSPLRRGVEATASAFRAIPEAAISQLPKVTQTGIKDLEEKVGTKFKKVTDLVSKIPGLEKWVMENPESVKSLEETLSITSAGGEIAGTILGVEGGINTASKLTGATKEVFDSINLKTPKIFDEIPNAPDKIADFISRDPDAKTATILKESTKENFDSYITAAKEAAVDPRKPTPYEIVGDKMANATKQLKEVANKVGAEKSEFLKPLRAGLDSFDSKNLVDDLVSLKNRMQDSAKSYVQGIIDKARNIKTKGGADRFIDEIQDDLFNSNAQKLIAEGSTLDKQVRSLLRKFNNELKDSLPVEYANLNAKYSNLTNVIRSLNRALGEVVEGVPVRGSSLIKQFFSPSGRKAKELFDYIKKNTGIDLAQDTTLARFAMELFDDPRARALLEGIPTSPRGLIEKGIDMVVEKTGLGGKFQETLRSSELRKARSQTK